MSNRIANLDPYSDTTNLSRIDDALSPERRKINRERFSPDQLDIFILNLDKPDLVQQLLDGLSKAHAEFSSKGFKLNVLIGDTGSTDIKTIDLLKNVPDFIQVIWFDSYNFSRSNNDLFEHGTAGFALFLNNDVMIRDNFESIMRSFELIQSDQSLAAVSVVLNFPDGSLQHGGIDFLRTPELRGFPFHPNSGKQWHHTVGTNFRAIAGTGAFLTVRSKDFAEVNGFNERYQAECQDVELCLEFSRRGSEIRILDCGNLVHLENATRPSGEENWMDRRLFMRNWSSFIEATQ